MPVIDAAFARGFAASWVDAWNSHDLGRVLDHFTDDFEFTSPLIVEILGEPSGVLRGKQAVGAYWAMGLERIPDLRFELVEVLAGVDSLVLYYRGHRGMAAETFFLGPHGKVRQASASYAAA